MQVTDKGFNVGPIIGAERLERCRGGFCQVGSSTLWAEGKAPQFGAGGFVPAGEDGFSPGVKNGDRRLGETTVQLASQIVLTPIRECWKEGRMWPFVAAAGSCGSTRLHDAEDFWTCPVAVPTLIVGEDGLMLAHSAPLAR